MPVRGFNIKSVFSVYLVLFFCLFTYLAYSQTEILCGKTVVGSIEKAGEKDTYYFLSSANDKLTIRAATTSGMLSPYLELYAPDGKRIANARGQIDKTIPSTGKYTLLVRDESNYWTGNYSLIFERLNNPCSQRISSGTINGSITSTERFKFYNFLGSNKSFITLEITVTSGFLSPYFELYDLDGIKINEADKKIGLLLTKNGPYTIVVRDRYNNYTGNFRLTLSIIKDETPPTGSIKINNGAQYTNSTSVTLNLSAQDNSGGVGLDKMQFSNDNTNWSTPEPYATTKTWTLTQGDGTKTVYVRFSDKVGNWSGAYSSTIILDTQPPPPPKINSVITPTDINYQTITGEKSSDTVSIIIEAPTATVEKINYPTATTWSSKLTNFKHGKNDIIVKAKDAAGNESSPASVSIAYTKFPSIKRVSPSSGSTLPNREINFTTTFSDDDGWNDIYYVLLLFNTSINGKNCFYGYYNLKGNKLYLRRDDGLIWLGGFSPGSNNIIENSYVKLNCAKTTVSGSGTTLTINWSITFKDKFIGVKNIYLYVKDNFGGYDKNSSNGWVKKGDFCIFGEPIGVPE